MAKLEMTAALKQSPYGTADYGFIRATGRACVDKTRFIELLEADGHLFPFFVRPRRFGKTLFTQMLKLYYDKAAAASFEENFRGTYIGRRKTALANQYYVLRIALSDISLETFEVDLSNNIKQGMSDFCKRYELPEWEKIAETNFETPQLLMGEFLRAFARHYQGELYLIIDEYDQAANEILSRDVEKFRSLTRSGGILKLFFGFLKQMADNGTIRRIFLTGVTVISLDSMTSGFSIANNFSTDPDFAGMYGFTEEELRTLIPQLVNVRQLGVTEDEVVARMREWYNGYRFSPDSDVTVFNASMCLYYLKKLKTTGKEPRQLMDPSVSQDLSKINGILSLGRPDFVREVVEKAVHGESIHFDGGLTLLNLQSTDQFSDQAVLSALFYMGFLTFAPGSAEELMVPNRAVAQQFFDYHFQYIRKFSNWAVNRSLLEIAFGALAEGNPEPLLRETERLLTKQCGIQKSLHMSEGDFQVCLLTQANLLSGYVCRAEVKVTGGGKGYADLILKADNAQKPSYIFELKHLTKKGGTPAAVTKVVTEAVEQLTAYVKGDNIRCSPRLICVAAVFVGTELKELKIFPAD